MIASGVLAVLLAAAGLPLHVDVRSAPGGDGSVERPFIHVSEALRAAPPGGTVLVETGLYEEELTIAQPVRLEGVGAKVVLAAPPGAATALAVRSDLVLVGVSVQGGRAGVQLESGSVTLEKVELRGQPDVALDCGAHPCTLREVHLIASFASAVGVHSTGALELEEVVSDGPFKHAIEVHQGAFVRGRGVRINEAPTGLFSRESDVELSDLTVIGGRTSCVFVSGGHVRLRDLLLGECGYGILAREKAEVSVEDAVVTGCADSPMAGVASGFTVRDWVSAGPSRDAAFALDNSRLALQGGLVFDPGSSGVRARVSKGSLAHLTVVRAREEGGSFGNAVFLADSEVTIDDLDAEREAGPAVEAQLGTTLIRGLTVVGGPAAVSMEFRSHLDVFGLMQQGGTGTGVACIEGSQGTLLAPFFQNVPAGNWLIDRTCKLSVRPASWGPTPP